MVFVFEYCVLCKYNKMQLTEYSFFDYLYVSGIILKLFGCYDLYNNPLATYTSLHVAMYDQAL